MSTESLKRVLLKLKDTARDIRKKQLRHSNTTSYLNRHRDLHHKGNHQQIPEDRIRGSRTHHHVQPGAKTQSSILVINQPREAPEEPRAAPHSGQFNHLGPARHHNLPA